MWSFFLIVSLLCLVHGERFSIEKVLFLFLSSPSLSLSLFPLSLLSLSQFPFFLSFLTIQKQKQRAHSKSCPLGNTGPGEDFFFEKPNLLTGNLLDGRCSSVQFLQSDDPTCCQVFLFFVFCFLFFVFLFFVFLFFVFLFCLLLYVFYFLCPLLSLSLYLSSHCLLSPHYLLSSLLLSFPKN